MLRLLRTCDAAIIITYTWCCDYCIHVMLRLLLRTRDAAITTYTWCCDYFLHVCCDRTLLHAEHIHNKHTHMAHCRTFVSACKRGQILSPGVILYTHIHSLYSYVLYICTLILILHTYAYTYIHTHAHAHNRIQKAVVQAALELRPGDQHLENAGIAFFRTAQNYKGLEWLLVDQQFLIPNEQTNRWECDFSGISQTLTCPPGWIRKSERQVLQVHYVVTVI